MVLGLSIGFTVISSMAVIFSFEHPIKKINIMTLLIQLILVIIFLFLPLGYADLVRLTPIDIIFALVLGLVPTALAFWLYNVGVKNDKGGNIIILAYFEPIMAVFNTIVVLQIFSIFTIIGGSLILIANIIVLKYSK